MSINLLETQIEYLKGVGPQRGELLRKELGIYKYGDLIHLFPNRYIDRTHYFKINQLQNTSSEVQIIGKIINIKTVEQKRGKRLVATFIDDTGQMEVDGLETINKYAVLQDGKKIFTIDLSLKKNTTVNI